MAWFCCASDGVGLLLVGEVVTEVLYKRMINMCVFIGEAAWVKKGLGQQPLLRYDRGFSVVLLWRFCSGVDESLRLYGQVNKRTWWMPWQPEAKKDVVDCEKHRGAVKQALIR